MKIRIHKTPGLYLNLKKEYFDRIACGRKRYEFRDVTPYWKNRLCYTDMYGEVYEFRDFHTINFRNGYGPDVPEMIVEHLSTSIRSWRGKKYFVIALGEIYDTGQACRICGCTWRNACPGGCSWVEPDLCSSCVDFKSHTSKLHLLTAGMTILIHSPKQQTL